MILWKILFLLNIHKILHNLSNMRINFNIMNFVAQIKGRKRIKIKILTLKKHKTEVRLLMLISISEKRVQKINIENKQQM